ncbi:MAG: Beta-lactamase [Ilumatobacteraceae bacterium]|nr:Beta-lactamase [Ilumatobacteraceae bacterium]
MSALHRQQLGVGYVPGMVPLPAQPDGVPWPTQEWPEAPLADGVDRDAVAAALDDIFAKPPELGVSLAVLVVHRGSVVAERYATGVDRDTTLISWSMAKSMTQAVVGMLVGDGLLDIDAPVDVAEFAGTERAAITLRDLLAMKSGLEFNEDYVGDVGVSHCLEMLFGAGVDDHAHYAASQQLLHPPGAVWSYSSGTTNIISRLAATVIAQTRISGDGSSAAAREGAMRAFLHDRLFGPLGMTSAAPKFDTAGTFVGSSYVYATARDFARFGLLYLRDGVWDGERLLPDGWVDFARTVVAVDDEPPHFGYGAHWWIWPEHAGSVAAHGYEGQYIVVLPDRDLVVVHLGKIPADVRAPLFPALEDLIAAFPAPRPG